MLKKSYIWLFLALGMMLSVGYNNASESKTMNEKEIDWKALEFTCKHEEDLWPRVDKEADVWFKQARKLEKENREGTEKYILELYEKAAAKDHHKAINNLVVIYHTWEGVEDGEAKAVDYAERLIKMNVSSGYYHMGVFLEQGIGVRQDRPASLVYFRKAADLGNRQGQLVVGKKLLSDFQQTPLRDKAVPIGIKMLECSLAQGEAEAGAKLGYFYAEDNNDLSLQYFQKAAALGHSQSLYNLYSTFKDEDYGIEKDPIRAACYDRLWREADEDKTKRFPNIDKICPLPPKPMPTSQK